MMEAGRYMIVRDEQMPMSRIEQQEVQQVIEAASPEKRSEMRAEAEGVNRPGFAGGSNS